MAALFVDTGSMAALLVMTPSLCVLLAGGMCKADFALHAVFPFLVDRPTFLGIMHGMDQKDFYGSSSFLAVARARLVLLVLLRVLCFLVGVDQKDSTSLVVKSCSAMACAGLVCWLRGTPRCVLLIVGLRRRQGWQYMAGFAGDDAHHVSV